MTTLEGSRTHDEVDAAVVDARARYAARRPESARQHEQARRFMPGGNTRSVLHHGPFPLRVVRAWDAVLLDADGHEYVDLLGEYSAGLYGHSHPVLVRAMTQAMEEGISRGAHTQHEVALAQVVCERFGLERVRFTSSGTEANLMALSAARAATGRERVLVFRGGYHGGVLSFAHGTSKVNVPYDVLLSPYNDAGAATALLREHGHEVAAVLVEPMLGASGCIPGEPAFLRALQQAAHDAGALVVLDEVMTSRTGSRGLGHRLGLQPDLVTLGKYVGGGSSFGAFGGGAEVLDLFDPTRPDALPHAGTFNNNVVSMAAGLAGLTEVYTPEAAGRHTARGNALRERLADAVAGAGLQVTGVGSLMAFHATTAAVRRPEDLVDADPRRLELLFLDLLDEGYYVAPRGYLALSLAPDDSQLDGFVEAVARVAAARAGLGRP